jgi:DNA-binding NarL/FixJ family response regulator
MPGGEGINTLRNIKSGASSPIVIIFTSNSYPFLEQTCVNAGADYVFQKSRDFGKVVGILKGLQENAAQEFIPSAMRPAENVVGIETKDLKGEKI